MIDLMKLGAKLTLDTKSYDSAMKKAEKDGDSFTKKMSAKTVAMGQMIGNFAEKAISSFVSLTKELFSGAIDAYADFEQLVGGVETLFGTRGAKTAEEYGKMVGLSGEEAEKAFARVTAAQDMVLENSKKAYQTAGISANRYMENATSFAASLVSSLHGDTYRAAELTDTAIQDMSDNANKMGSSMESIEHAYQGFAKQNFTMLDNLKLGYGGTKEEMERLLNDAGALAGKKFDSSSFADIVEAIHIIQENKGITGTTAKEAATTITGSINMMKASWQNLLTAMGDPDGDIDAVADQFFESFNTVFENIGPVFKRVLSGLIKLVKRALPEIGKFIKNDLIPEIRNIIRGLIDDLKNSDNPFAQALGFLGDGLSLFIDENGNFRLPSFDELWAKLEPALDSLWKGVREAAQKVLILIFGEDENGGVDWPTPEEWGKKIEEGVRKLWDAIKSAAGKILRLIFGETEDGGIDWPTPEELWDKIKTGLETLWNAVKGLASGILKIIFGETEDGGIAWPTPAELWEKIKQGLSDLWDGIKRFAGSILKFIFGESEDGGIAFPTPEEMWEKVKTAFSTFWEGLSGLITSAASWLIGDVMFPLASFVINKVTKWWNEEIRPNLNLKVIINPVIEGIEGLTNHIGSSWLDWGDTGTAISNLTFAVFKGRAKGDWNVPYDNFPAMLHRGEMVLTASQARKYRDGEAEGIDTATLIPAIVTAIRQGMNGAQVNSYMDSTRVTKETNGVTGNKLAAGRFA